MLKSGLSFKLAVSVTIALWTLAVFVALACGAATKPILRQVDEHVQLACEGLAQALAEKSGADAQRIIGATCAVEGLTRTMRELLLSAQIQAAQRAGVAVPQVTSDALQADPYQTQDAE